MSSKISIPGIITMVSGFMLMIISGIFESVSLSISSNNESTVLILNVLTWFTGTAGTIMFIVGGIIVLVKLNKKIKK